MKTETLARAKRLGIVVRPKSLRLQGDCVGKTLSQGRASVRKKSWQSVEFVMSISFACGNCRKIYRVDDRFAGKRVSCKACGTINVIPEAKAKPAKAPSPEEPLPVEGDMDLAALEQAAAAEGYAVAEPSPAPGRGASGGSDVCPGCGSVLPAGSVFCTGCGYNLRTGRQASTKVTASAPSEARPRPVARRKESSRGSGGDEENSAGGGLAMWLIIIGGTSGIMPAFGKQWTFLIPLGTGAMVAGALIAIAGAVIFAIKQNWFGVGCGAIAAIVSLGIYFTVASRPVDDDAPGEDPGSLASSKIRRPNPIRDPRPDRTPSNTNTQPPPPPANSDFMVDGRPKIVVRGGGSRVFGRMLSYEHLRVPEGQDAIEFYRPCLQHANADIRLCAQEVLLKYTPQERKADAVAAIGELVGDQDGVVRGKAVEAQGLVHNASTVANLIKALDDPEPAIRKDAIRLLGAFRDEAALQPLLSHLADDEAGVLSALARYGPEHKDKVAAAYAGMLSHADAKLRLRALQNVIANNSQGCGEQILPLLDDADANVRRIAIDKLVALKFEPAIEKLAAKMGQDASISAALAKFGPAAETVAIAKAAEPDAKARLAAVRLLEIVGTRQCLEIIRTAANDDDADVSQAARAVWAKLEPGAATPVALAMLDLDSPVPAKQARGLKALAQLKPDNNQETLAKKLFDMAMGTAEAPIPELAGKALRVWANAGVRDALLQCLEPASDDEKRRRAIPMLIEFKDPRAVAALCKCLEEGKEADAVCQALCALGPGVEDHVLRLLRSENATALEKACEVLKEIGTRKSLQPLSAIALDTRHPSRDLARETAAAINRRLARRP